MVNGSYANFILMWYVLDDPNWTTNILNDIFELHEEIEEVNHGTRPFEDKNLENVIENTFMSNSSDLHQMPGHCRSELWSCLSSLLERGIRHVKNPEDVFRWSSILRDFKSDNFRFNSSVQKVLYKAVFHGGVKSMWTSVMEIKEMRNIGACIKDHDICVEHSILSSYLNWQDQIKCVFHT